MNSREALKLGINGGQFIADMYLEDLTDAELMVRPVPGSNHIAWQLGHLIGSEHNMVEAARPNSMPALPAGFAEKHSKETCKSDDPKAFLSKAEYIKLMKQQRAATLAALDAMSDEELDQPAPESMRAFLKVKAEVFSLQGSHWLMHAGQWALVRRKLGRPPLF